MDETPVKAGRLEGKMKSGYFWPVMGQQDEVCFPFFLTRGKQCVEDVLGVKANPDKVLLTDDYPVYQSYTKKTAITHAQCWVHARRQFFEAQAANPERAEIALRYIRHLFLVEDNIAALTLKGEHKCQHRLTHSKPIVERFYAWIDAQFAQHGLLPSDPFVQAMSYAKDHRVALEVFLTDPDMPLDTNHIERTL